MDNDLTLYLAIEKLLDARFGHLTETLERMERKMAQFDTDLQALTDAQTALGNALNTGLADIKAQITALQAQVAAGTPVTAAQLAQLEAVTTNLAAETAAVIAADPGPQTPPTTTPPPVTTTP